MGIAKKQVAEAKSSAPPQWHVTMTVYRITSVYIIRNEVEQRLGKNVEVHSRCIRLTYSQITLASTCSHPGASGG